MALLRTPLFDCHVNCGARFTDFCGWEMPVQYSGVANEHKAVRRSVGVFDVSHMGEFVVRGPKALKYLQYVTSNDVSSLVPGKAQYSLLLNEQGGVVDDVIVYQLDEEKYLLCVNACNVRKDEKWLLSLNSIDAHIENCSSAYSQIALQGPNARRVLSKVIGCEYSEVSPENMPLFRVKLTLWEPIKESPIELVVATTGYTGEDGCEIYVPNYAGALLWESVIANGEEFGLLPAGLGARDTLRLEACYPLHGHEISDDINAVSSGLSWVMKPDKGEFVGRGSVVKAMADKHSPRLVGLEVVGRGIVRHGALLFDGTTKIGWVTSGTMTPTIEKAVALGYVELDSVAVGQTFEAEVRGHRLPVRVVRTPFYKRS